MSKNSKVYISILIISILFSFLIVRNSTASLNIPITVQEALSKDVSGIDRTNEPLTIGIPLMDSDNIKDISQLGLSGVSMGQFRVLRRYDSGNIQWVLIDTQVSLPANGTTTIYLTTGSDNFGGEDLAKDNGDYITINTGKAQFKIRKKNFNFFDSVVVDGEEFITSNNQGSIVALSDGTYYKSINDPNSTAIIEENGPVRAVIKADGKLLDENGDFLFGYTARLHFYKNKPYVKAVVTIKNAYYDSPSVKSFQGIWIEIPTALNGTLYYKFARKDDEISGQIDGVAYMYQAFNTHKTPDTAYSGNQKLKELLCSQDGLEIKNGSQVINSLGNKEDYSQGWAEIYQQNGKGITFGIRNFDAFWPDAYELHSDGTIQVELLSKHNNQSAIFGWKVHDSRKIIFDFHNSPINNKARYYTLQYHLVGKAPWQQYVKTGAIYGEKRLVSYEKEKQFFQELGYNYNLQNKNEEIKRWGRWDDEYDYALCYTIDWLRTGFGNFYLKTENQNWFKVNYAIIHSDDFNWMEKQPSEPPDYWREQNKAYNTCFYDGDHIQDISMPLYYYLTGDEGTKDALIDHIEYLGWFESNLHAPWGSFTRDLSQAPIGDLRAWARDYRSAAVYYYFLKGFGSQYQELTQKYLYYLTYMTKQLLKYRDNPSDEWQDGWNLDRGYWYSSGTSKTKNYEKEKINSPAPRNVCFMLTSMTMVGVQFAYQALPVSLLKEDLENFQVGLGWFDYLEYTPVNQYVYYLDKANTLSTRNYYDYLGYSFATAYENSGKEELLEYIRPLLWKVGYGGPFKAHPFTQCVIYDYLHKNETYVCYINPVGNGEVTLKSENITKNPDGTYTLTWTVPVDGIYKYQIKFSDQPLVENLNFNQWNETKIINGVEVPPRSYQFDPDIYDNFWAALNIDNEPEPGKKGENQSITIDIQDVINAYNQRCGLKEGDPAYIKYDPNKTYYFAIKYWTRGELPLSINTYTPLLSGLVGQSYSQTIQATGGSGSYIFSVTSGNLPSGLSLSSDGVLSGTPTQAGTFTFTIKVTDSSNPAKTATKEFTITVNEQTQPFTITTEGLPDGIVGTEYNATLSASGGTTPYTWSLISGSLPTGLTLSNAGVISGTPSAAGTYNFSVKVEDSSSPKKQATKQFSINVNEQTQPLTITTESLPDGIVGTQYSATLSASGGMPPYTWSINSGSLPNGLTPNSSTGAISGTPIEQGTYSFTVQVQDADSNTAAKNLSITINPSDTTSPVRSNGSPTGELPAGTMVTLSLTTDEDATCRYSTTPGIPYASMTNTFSNTGSTSHSTTITGLSNGNTYNYYIKCIDTYNNANTDDYLISFSIASAVASPSEPTIIVSKIKPDCTGESGLCFTSLAAWEEARQGDITASGRNTIEVAECYPMVDTTPVVIDGWKTDPEHYIKIYTPASERHNGKWDDTKYRLEVDNNHAIVNLERYVRIDGLQTKLTTNTEKYAIWSKPDGPSDVRVSNNIIKGVVSGGRLVTGINTCQSDSSAIHKCWNNIIYGFNKTDGAGIGNYNGTLYAYNNTVSNCNIGILNYDEYDAETYAVNNAVFNNNDDFKGTFALCDHNASDDLDGENAVDISPGQNEASDWADAFVDYINEDFHIKDTNSILYDAGLSDPGLGLFSDDIDGDTRSDTWDIGADEYCSEIGKVSNLTATPGDGQVELSWINPDDSDFLGMLIVFRNDRYPADYNDGTVVCDLTNSSPGSEDTFLHSGLQNGNLYYYAAFAYDTDGNYSGPAYVSATPTNDNPAWPPADVTNFTATAGNAQVTLSWINPTDADFAGTMIRYRTDGIYPVDYNDGILVCDRKNTPGSSDIFVHRGLQNGTTYYYSAFSYDAVGNYSQTAHAEATPEGLDTILPPPPNGGSSFTPNDGVSEPDISLSETGHNYGQVEIGSYSDWTLVIENKGNGTLTIDDIYSDNADFGIVSPTSFPKDLCPGQGLEVEVRFSPSTEGEISGGLTIDSNDPDDSSLNVSLSGKGVISQYNDLPAKVSDFTDAPCPTINAMRLDMGSILSGGTGIVNHYDFGEFGTPKTMPYIYVQTTTASDSAVDVYVKVTYPDDRSAWLYYDEEAGAMIYHDPAVTPSPEYSDQVFSENTVLPILIWWVNPEYKYLKNTETGGYELPDGNYTWTVYLLAAGTSISSPDDVEANARYSITASITLSTNRP